MYSLLSLTTIAFCVLFFLYFLGKELNIRHMSSNMLASWFPVFIPLVILTFARFVIAFAGIFLHFRRKRVAQQSEVVDVTKPRNPALDDSVDPETVQLFDNFVNAIVWFILFILVLQIVWALGSNDTTPPGKMVFYGVEITFYAFCIVYFWLFVNAAVRMWAISKFNADPTRQKFLWISNPSPLASLGGANKASERHTTSRVYVVDKYQTRDVWQYNKAVYVFTPDMLPHPLLDMAHVFMLILFKIAIFVSAVMLFERIRQVERVLLDSTTASDTMTTNTTLGWGHLNNAAGVHIHLIHSISEWRGKVLPLAVVFIPLFISEGVLILYAIPQFVLYICQRRPLLAYVTGVVYFVCLVMLILFEALLAARIDVGSTEDTNWHNTLAPLYTACIVILIGFGLQSILFRNQPVAGSHWGLYW